MTIVTTLKMLMLLPLVIINQTRNKTSYIVVPQQKIKK